MGTTTFTGPVRAGNILNTTGTTPGANVANVGSVVMAQFDNVSQTTGDTTIISIPAGSSILSMTLAVTTAWDGGATTLGIGTMTNATYYTAAGAVDGSTIGYVSVPVASGVEANWINVGTVDTQIVVSSTNAGSGLGVLYVTYIQGPNGGN